MSASSTPSANTAQCLAISRAAQRLVRSAPGEHVFALEALAHRMPLRLPFSSARGSGTTPDRRHHVCFECAPGYVAIFPVN